MSDDESELTASLLGDVPRFTAQEVAEQAGVTLEQAQRLWRTLGFPEGDGSRLYTGADTG